MSLQLIEQYYTEVERKIRYGGSRKETTIRTAFQRLLEHYAQAKNLELVPELDFRTRAGKTVYPDGTLKDALRESWGYWESKDQDDTLDQQITKKFDVGYPKNNILFEDSQTAVLYQNGREVGRVEMQKPQALHALLQLFFNFEPPEVREFYEAIEQFKEDLPDLLETLRAEISQQAQTNTAFRQARDEFLAMCQKSINPHLVMDDVREMIIQHILTEEIFMTVFDEAQYHRENNIARELNRIVGTFFSGNIRRQILGKIDQYYRVIKARAAQIANHHEKQRFLKIFYENFYKEYNPKGADRLGIVYTPNEIVKFMIESADHLTYQHFGKFLADDGVQILDPATGTGTFITELIEYLPPHRLPHKYAQEIHCNEVGILPYYIANLNIEYTYAQKMKQYAEFTNICFVDTLDNLGFGFEGKQHAMDFGFTPENIERIQQQNAQQISVIMGNPPYNANQLNENENNKNREYPGVDERIKNSYIKHSTAQKTKLYDMYTRFIRWASDRLGDQGVIAFVSNSSFIDARTYDGFRKVVAEEFDYIYIIDMKGNARTSGERRRQEGGNVFSDEIRVGVAVYFLVRLPRAESQARPAQIHYYAIRDYAKAEEKKAFLRDNKFENIPFDHIRPGPNYYWLNQPEHDWEDLLPVASKQTKYAKKPAEVDAIFDLYSLGVVTNRDDWVYDFSAQKLCQKVRWFIEQYNHEISQFSGGKVLDEDLTDTIKWTRDLKKQVRQQEKMQFSEDNIISANYRPFVKKYLYFDQRLNEMQYQLPSIFPNNIVICINVGTKPFNILASKYLVDLHFNGDSQCLPLYRYDEEGHRQENITDFARQQFRAHYNQSSDDSPTTPTIDKLAIFHYVYAVLHNPAYREKYELNLKREFPRIPFYEDFWQWVAWGQELLELHINYETVAPYPLERQDKPVDSQPAAGPPAGYRAKLKADKEAGVIELDSLTTLRGIPAAAWDYKLGNRSALEWVLDRYKERKPRDPTIREKFNSYRFWDYRESVIQLLGRVCRVSLETQRIVGEMAE